MTQFKIQRRKYIHVGIVTEYYMIDADSQEEAERQVLENEADPYDSDYDIEQSEHFNLTTEEN